MFYGCKTLHQIRPAAIANNLSMIINKTWSSLISYINGPKIIKCRYGNEISNSKINHVTSLILHLSFSHFFNLALDLDMEFVIDCNSIG